MEIWIKNDSYNIRLPVNPASYSLTEESNNTQANLTTFGQVNLIGKRKLKAVTFSTFLPAQEYAFCQITPEHTPTEYREIFEAMKEKGVCTLTLTDRSLSMDVTIESLTFNEDDGSGDLNVTFSFLEYRLPQVTRLTKEITSTTFTLTKRMSLSEIAKKVSGSGKNWQAVYEDNKDLVTAKKVKKSSKLPKGTTVVIRDKYPY